MAFQAGRATPQLCRIPIHLIYRFSGNNNSISGSPPMMTGNPDMTVDLKLTDIPTGTPLSGEAWLSSTPLSSRRQSFRRFLKYVGWFVVGCLGLVLLPMAWMFWEWVRPLSAHEQLLVGTWAVGSVDEIDRWDEERPGIPCGVPRLEYHFHSDRTFHARKICYFQGCGLFQFEDPGPSTHDVVGKWEVRGNDIILLPMQPLPSYSSRLKSAVQELSQGQNPLTCFNDGYGHDIHVTEWRSDGPLFTDDRFRSPSEKPMTEKMHRSNGDLLQLHSLLFHETWPLMLSSE